jgi:hypothetical protein
MLMYMTGERWQDRVSSGEVVRRCGVEELEVELRRRRQRSFGHVARAKDGSVLRLTEVLQVERRRPPGRPKKTWRRRIHENMDVLGLEEVMAQDRGE